MRMITNYIELNQWDKTYEFFSGFFSQINKILIKYVKYKTIRGLKSIWMIRTFLRP